MRDVDEAGIVGGGGDTAGDDSKTQLGLVAVVAVRRVK